MISKPKHIEKLFKYLMYIKTNSKKKIWEYVQLKGHKEKQYADTN